MLKKGIIVACLMKKMSDPKIQVKNPLNPRKATIMM
jgi:hypothetical protein